MRGAFPISNGMRLHRFYINQAIQGKEIVIENKELFHQWRDVFRLNVGSQVILFNGDGVEYRSTLVALNFYDTRALVLETTKNSVPTKRSVHLFASLIKKDNLEWVFEKATELGVTQFHPMLSERSEKKNFNIERAEKIIIEAVEQSGRGILPLLYPLTPLIDTFGQNVFPMFVLHAEGEPFAKVMEWERSNGEVGIFVGPEGGWSDRELAQFKEKNIPFVSLGTATLRAETAAIAVATLLLL